MPPASSRVLVTLKETAEHLGKNCSHHPEARPFGGSTVTNSVFSCLKRASSFSLSNSPTRLKSTGKPFLLICT